MKILYQKQIKKNQKITSKDIINILLKNRKIKDTKEFLNPSTPLNISLSDFKLKEAFKKALKILKRIKQNNEMIVVYTDYDADGITGGAILWETLHLLGFKVMPYIPHRKHEGYGFSKKGIDKVKKEFNPKLIITVDHGISSDEKIKYAKTLGISVIITDHHIKPKKLPKNAECIFHISELSGAGVAYFFAKEIFEEFKKKSKNNLNKLKTLELNFKYDYLSLAAIGIVADLIPLIGKSRSIVKHGTQAFKDVKRCGIKHIINEAGIKNDISTYEIGFIIAPRINAVGRLGHAMDALRLLCTTNNKKACELAYEIGKTNTKRQKLVEKAFKTAKIQVEKMKKLNKIIILKNNDWHEGIIGLIASKIMQEYYRPVIIMTQSNGFLKGSARSISSFNITDFLKSMKRLLVDIGGHKQAAGFTIKKESVQEFIKKAVTKANRIISKTDLEKSITADIKIPLSKITLSLVKSLEILKPFGIANPKPLFYSKAEILDVKIIGKRRNHIKIIAKDPDIKSYPIELLLFNSIDKFNEIQRGQIIDVVYNLQINKWNGKETTSFIIKHFS